jgi:hypothetical protein
MIGKVGLSVCGGTAFVDGLEDLGVVKNKDVHNFVATLDTVGELYSSRACLTFFSIQRTGVRKCGRRCSRTNWGT